MGQVLQVQDVVQLGVGRLRQGRLRLPDAAALVEDLLPVVAADVEGVLLPLLLEVLLLGGLPAKHRLAGYRL